LASKVPFFWGVNPQEPERRSAKSKKKLHLFSLKYCGRKKKVKKIATENSILYLIQSLDFVHIKDARSARSCSVSGSGGPEAPATLAAALATIPLPSIAPDGEPDCDATLPAMLPRPALIAKLPEPPPTDGDGAAGWCERLPPPNINAVCCCC
jgi:hypothetical protein